jgi:uncharacterized damage-inducible protein DinB
MKTAELLANAFGRISDVVHQSAAGLTAEQLAFRPGPDANSIGWLLWHLTRVQDDHVSEVAGTEQVWTAAGWADRYALPFGDDATGWGQSSAEVGAVRVASPDLLTGYHDAVHARTLAFLATVTDASLDAIVDERWDPPVSLGVRLVSVISDDLQHAGQAAYLRGLVLTG